MRRDSLGPAMHVEAEVALKEWAVVCGALRDGRHGLLLRKGGIREANAERTFHAEHRAFALLPTYFHARDAGRERDLIPELHAGLAEQGPPAGALRVDLYAEVTGLWHLRELAQARALAGRHALSDACVTDRFNYRGPGLWALHLRVHRLSAPVDLPDRPGYAGCVSWVHLDRPVRGAAAAVVADDEHERRQAALTAALGVSL